MKNPVEAAATLAKIAHAGMKYGEDDYFERHVMDVVNRVSDAEHATFGHLTVAYLHDVVEDTSVTLPDLLALGFSEEVVAAVAAISRMDGEEYLSEYIPRVMKNEMAAFVKYHDLRSNTNTGTPVSMARRNLEAMRMMK